MPVSELGALLDKVEYLATNKASGQELSDRGELALSDGVLRVQISGKYTTETLEAAPERATEASYRLSNSGSGVSLVSLQLHNFRRELVVEGTDQARVESLVQFISAELEGYETHLTGLSAKLSILLLLGFIGVIVWTRWPAYGPLVLIPLGMATWFLVSSDSLLPSTVIFADEPSWLTRFAPHLTLAGFVVSSIGLALALIRTGGRRNRSGEESTAKLASEPDG